VPPSNSIFHSSEDLVERVHLDLQNARVDVLALERTAEKLRDDPHQLRRSLARLLRSNTHMEEIADRSYQHANGFAKVVLHISRHYGIRLHVWRPDEHPSGQVVDPHGHRWEFASWIITGVLHEITFEPAASGELFDEYAHEKGANGEDYLRPRRSATLARTAHADRKAGHVYKRSSSELHAAMPTGGALVASLVLQGPRSSAPVPVYRRPGAPGGKAGAPVRIPKSSFSVRELRSLLGEVSAVVA
jgi:hypothetical protein